MLKCIPNFGCVSCHNNRAIASVHTATTPPFEILELFKVFVYPVVIISSKSNQCRRFLGQLSKIINLGIIALPIAVVYTRCYTQLECMGVMGRVVHATLLCAIIYNTPISCTDPSRISTVIVVFVIGFGHWVCEESWHAIKDSLTHRPSSQGWEPGVLPFYVQVCCLSRVCTWMEGDFWFSFFSILSIGYIIVCYKHMRLSCTGVYRDGILRSFFVLWICGLCWYSAGVLEKMQL